MSRCSRRCAKRSRRKKTPQKAGAYCEDHEHRERGAAARGAGDYATSRNADCTLRLLTRILDYTPADADGRNLSDGAATLSRALGRFQFLTVRLDFICEVVYIDPNTNKQYAQHRPT